MSNSPSENGTPRPGDDEHTTDTRRAGTDPFTDPATTERTVVLLGRLYRRYLAAQSEEGCDDAAVA